ncbi:hypothetical protein Tco_1579263, partial [Tanacetum coccineum]
PLPTSTSTTSIIKTTTSLPPPPQPQQSTADPILVSRIGELEQHMAYLIQKNLALDERDLPTVDMKEILQQRMFEDNSYKAHEEEARKKKRKKRAALRTPSGSPPSPSPPPPPLAGASSASGTSGASGSSQLPPHPPPPSIGTSGSDQLQGSKAPMRPPHINPWLGLHLTLDSSQLWKPLPEEERPATPEPAWTIPSSNKSNVVNNCASALATTYEPPAENSLLAKIGDMTTLLKWYCRQVNKTTLTQADFEGQAYEVVKAFYPDVIHLQFQMEECHNMLIDQVDWANPKGDQGHYSNRFLF